MFDRQQASRERRGREIVEELFDPATPPWRTTVLLEAYLVLLNWPKPPAWPRTKVVSCGRSIP